MDSCEGKCRHNNIFKVIVFALVTFNGVNYLD